ncbi:MAG: lanthionine synthetase LanC family protein [Bacteroidota bacterium]|nr:lanthionine synthetase LanC family protein [Bacteroidota bacterium]
MKRLPLFDENFSRKFLRPHIQSIAKAVSAQICEIKQPGWMTGLAGMAVLLGESAYFMDEKPNSGDEKSEALARIMGVINDGFNFPTLAAGLTGILFAFRYLGERKLIDSDDAHALDEIIPFLKKWGESRIENGDFDMLHGGLGPLFVLSSGPGRWADLLVDKWTDSLVDKWADSRIGPYGDLRNIDLGLAHGLPSYLLCLSNINIQSSQIKTGLNTLLATADFTQKHGSVFPTRIKDGLAQYPSRLAWCYGDAGIGISLMLLEERLLVERFSGLTGVHGIGQKVLELAAERRDQKNTRVEDPYLCHGSSGLALIFFKAYLLSKNDKFKEAAQYWTKETLNYLNTSYSPNHPVTQSPNSPADPSLLNGLSGIGLTLMAIDKGYLPGWEKGLLL